MIRSINDIPINKKPDEKTFTPKVATKCNKVWPAVMFALNRIDKLNARIVYEIISRTIKKGKINKGIVSGTKNLNQRKPFSNKPI